MRGCIIFISLLFLGSDMNAQITSGEDSLGDDLQPYEYDTILKGGYKILFKADDSLEYLYLKKGNKIITELSSCSRGLPYKNLGYVAADFKEYFVLVHSYGSGNPHYIELIKKTSGKDNFKNGAVWIDAKEDKEILLYCDNDVPSPKDKMILYNIKTGRKQFFSFPNDIFAEPQVLNRIQIEKLTEKQLTIKYETEKGEKKKTYNL
jgi:hypothetical protein